MYRHKKLGNKGIVLFGNKENGKVRHMYVISGTGFCNYHDPVFQIAIKLPLNIKCSGNLSLNQQF